MVVYAMFYMRYLVQIIDNNFGDMYYRVISNAE